MDVNQIYDENYAKSYDDRFLTSEYAKISSDFELSIIRENLGENSKWLDVGCGTGYFLEQFQKIDRCGIDLSSEMLKMAKLRNKSAQFIEGDFREVLNEMSDNWDFVSCMWTPYNYLNSMYEFDDFLTNLVKVTNIGGSLFIPVVDLEDLRPHTILDYEMKTDVHGGNVYLTSSTWTWVEKDGNKVHKHLIAPQIDYFIESLNGFFEKIEVVRYPVYKPGWVSKKAILATSRCIKKSSSELIMNSTINNEEVGKENLTEDKNVLENALVRFIKRIFYK